MSKYINMSKYHFSHVFRQQFHVSPMKYIGEKRIELAKNYLIYTNDSMEEIAEQLGFYDQAHFCRSFKQAMKMSPSKFRKMQ